MPHGTWVTKLHIWLEVALTPKMYLIIVCQVVRQNLHLLPDYLLPLSLIDFIFFFIKGFAIGSAALVSLALFGAFVSRAGISIVNVLSPKVFIGLIVGGHASLLVLRHDDEERGKCSFEDG